MTQSPEIIQQAVSYIRHQATKSLSELAALMERTGDECARCLEDVSDAQAPFSHGEERAMKEGAGHMIGRPAGGARPIGVLRWARARLWQETGGLVASLPEGGNLERTWDHPWFGPLNFKEWIVFQRLHAMDHVQQIERLREHPDYPEA